MSKHRENLDNRLTVEQGKELLNSTTNSIESATVAVIAARHSNTPDKEEWAKIQQEADAKTYNYDKKYFDGE